ncbi:MAG TPA: hypothetical protein VJN96_19705 [Vicinamibacterales bacterium]|nr:hypothetical protein [Vicinamibacterales bacterium]
MVVLQSRRTRVQHVSTDGSFGIARLPAGEYALAGVIDLGSDGALDPLLLQ